MVIDNKKLHINEENSEQTSQSVNETGLEAKGHERLAPKSSAKPIKTYMTPNYTINGIDVQTLYAQDLEDNTDFNSFVGLEVQKESVKEIFSRIKYQSELKSDLKISSDRFILLYGTNECDLSTFARSIAYEYKKIVNDEDTIFLNIKSESIEEESEEQTLKNIITIFEYANQFKHCVMFFDTFENLVPSRTTTNEEVNHKANAKVNTFLRIVNSIDYSRGILIIAASNYPDMIDSAVLARINKIIEVPMPSKDVL